MIVASRRAVVRVSPWAPLALAGALPFCAVGLTAAVNGGYFPTEWGWPALAFLLVTVLVVLIREHVALCSPCCGRLARPSPCCRSSGR